MNWPVEPADGLGPVLFAYDRAWAAIQQGGGQPQDGTLYGDAPAVPGGMTLAAYRRSRSSSVTHEPRPSVFRRARVLFRRRLAPVRALVAEAGRLAAAPDAAKAPHAQTRRSGSALDGYALAIAAPPIASPGIRPTAMLRGSRGASRRSGQLRAGGKPSGAGD